MSRCSATPFPPGRSSVPACWPPRRRGWTTATWPIIVRRRRTRSPRSTPRHRGKDGPTDVLSFPVDGAGPAPGPPSAPRARRRGDLPGAHRGPRRGGRARRAAPARHGSRDRRRRDARAPGGGGLVAEVAGTRSGFVALAGRPNVGKSTLLNAMVGHKVAIVSDKPQTTRRAIRGVATRDDVQIVLTDLPGVQRPRDELTRRMQRRVEQELGGADAALFVLNADQGVGGPGDVWIAEALRGAKVPVVIAVNKVDRTSTRAHGRGAPGRRRPRPGRRGVPGLGAHGPRRRGARWTTWPRCCRRGRSTSRPRRSPTSRSRSCWPSSCASRCSPARARRCRTRSRCRSRRSPTAAT